MGEDQDVLKYESLTPQTTQFWNIRSLIKVQAFIWLSWKIEMLTRDNILTRKHKGQRPTHFAQ